MHAAISWSENTERQINMTVHCDGGDHSEHDPGMVDDDGNCPGLPPVRDDHLDDYLSAEEIAEQEVDFLAADAAHAMDIVRAWEAYGPFVEAPEPADYEAVAQWQDYISTGSGAGDDSGRAR